MLSSETIQNKADLVTDPSVLDALNAIGRAVNAVTTYGVCHPVFCQAIAAAMISLQILFINRRKIRLGICDDVMTVDDVPVDIRGAVLKSVEHRLIRLRIGCLSIRRGVTEGELVKLAELLAGNQAEAFRAGAKQANFSHIDPQTASLRSVRDDQAVVGLEDLAARRGAHEAIVIEEEPSASSPEPTVHVEQIVAFLKGDIPAHAAGKELVELASDPSHLGRLIMESVAIRQTASQLEGESFGDIVLGCLRRTYGGLREKPVFQSTKGIVTLKKSLLLLEKSMLEKVRQLAGDPNPELDRQIVQTIREMDENLGFELAANEYVAQRDALCENEQRLRSYVQEKGVEMAEELISGIDFPSSDWRRIVVESQHSDGTGTTSSIVAGLDSLATVFEKLEALVKSGGGNEGEIEGLLGQASQTLDETLCSTREKLDNLSNQLSESEKDTGTIGGQASDMDRKELLSSISEISQELMQPLTAITASLEMLLGGYAGALNHDQRTMLEIASNSGEHLTFLMKELIDIVGFPVNRGVDGRFHTTSKQIDLPL